MEAFLYSLVVAAITGLTWIAYRHPEGYKRLYLPLMAVVAATILVVGSYSIGVQQGFAVVYTYIATNKTVLAEMAADKAQFHEIEIYAPAAGTFAYLSFLFFLHEILGDQPKGQ